MKVAKLLWDGEPNECLLIETFEDILEYQKLVATNTSDTFSRVVKQKIKPDSWDHYGQEGVYGNSFNMAVQKAKVFGGRPVLMFDQITNDKCISILKQINLGEKVVINKVGGWCTVMEGLHEIIEVSEVTSLSTGKKSVIKNNTTYINLENDPYLENRTKQYLGVKDNNFSFVLRLCEFSDKELFDVFKEFQSKGGKIVYVYTTGSDVQQMWDYCEQIVKSGLKEVEFEFNSGIEPEHKEIIKYLESEQVHVQVLGD